MNAYLDGPGFLFEKKLENKSLQEFARIICVCSILS
jgi:hypothetical protein